MVADDCMLPDDAASSASRITAVQPLWAVEGGQVVISGEGFPVDPPVQVRIGGELARADASSRRRRSP